MKLVASIFCLMISCVAFAQHQALSQLVYEIRDPSTDSAHFRQALEKIGEYLALEVLDELETTEESITTLMQADAKHQIVQETPVLVTILRAGLPLNNGVQKIFQNSEVGFLAMSRNEKTLKADVDYIALPDLKDRCVIIVDTMLATGGSLLDAVRIVEQGCPKKIFVIAAIASEYGLERVCEYNPHIKVFSAAVDPVLNERGYIVPGLGDAGDRSFGMKHLVSMPTS